MVDLQEDNNTLTQTLKRIEERLRRIERDLKSSSEDQLFFALVFPLAVLFLTLPTDNLRRFFQDFAKFSPNQANSVAQTVLYVGFSCLLISSIIRYYGAVVGRVRRSKVMRVFSLELLIMAWDAVLFLVVVTALLNAHELLLEYTFPLAALTTLFIFIGMVWIEKRVLAFYAARFLIFKRDVTPIVSSLFAVLALALYIGFLVPAALTMVFVLSSGQFVGIFVMTWLATYVVLHFIYLYGLRKRTRR